MRELLVHVSVYRAYVRPGHSSSPEAITELDSVAAQASASRPDLAATIEALRHLLDRHRDHQR
ncbi:MAG: hypothetical protein WKF73_12205 [Nocardioidaceae bacterium]